MTIASLMVRIGADMTEFDRGMQRAAKNIMSFGQDIRTSGRDLSRMGSQITMGVTLPITAIGYAAIKAAGGVKALGPEFVALKHDGAMALAEIGRAIIPIIREMIPTLRAGIQTVISVWRDLGETGQRFVIITAMIVAGIGPLLKAFALLKIVIGSVIVLMSVAIAHPIIAGLLAVAAAVALIAANWEKVRRAMVIGMRGGVTGTAGQVTAPPTPGISHAPITAPSAWGGGFAGRARFGTPDVAAINAVKQRLAAIRTAEAAYFDWIDAQQADLTAKTENMWKHRAEVQINAAEYAATKEVATLERVARAAQIKYDKEMALIDRIRVEKERELQKRLTEEQQYLAAWGNLMDTFTSAIGQAAIQFSSASEIMRAAIRSLIAQLVAAIAKAILLKTVMAATGMGSGASFWSVFKGVLGFATTIAAVAAAPATGGTSLLAAPAAFAGLAKPTRGGGEQHIHVNIAGREVADVLLPALSRELNRRAA